MGCDWQLTISAIADEFPHVGCIAVTAKIEYHKLCAKWLPKMSSTGWKCFVCPYCDGRQVDILHHRRIEITVNAVAPFKFTKTGKLQPFSVVEFKNDGYRFLGRKVRHFG